MAKVYFYWLNGVSMTRSGNFNFWWTTAPSSTVPHLTILSAYVEPSDAQIGRNNVAEILIIVLCADSYQEHLQGPSDLLREPVAMEIELPTDAGDSWNSYRCAICRQLPQAFTGASWSLRKPVAMETELPTDAGETVIPAMWRCGYSGRKTVRLWVHFSTSVSNSFSTQKCSSSDSAI